MRVGQRCRLRLTNGSRKGKGGQDHDTAGDDGDGFTVTGVVVGVRSHAECSTRHLCYFHCTHVEFGAELARMRRKASAPSWSGAQPGCIGSGTVHRSNQLRVATGGFVSSEGYHYRYDGWYEACCLLPLTVSNCVVESNRALGAEKTTAEVSTKSPQSLDALAEDSQHLLPALPEEWVASMEGDTAVCEVVYLCYTYQPWFSVPYRALQYLAPPDEDRCYSAYVCHRCLSPFFTREQQFVHLAGRYCRFATPPGNLIYSDARTGHRAYLVDGAKNLHYGRCLSLLGKGLIESKLLSNDVDLCEFVVVTIPRESLPFVPFLGSPPTAGPETAVGCAATSSAGPFPLLTPETFRRAAAEFDVEEWEGHVVVGYFSRLKHHPDHTLSCIVTLPMFQRMRVATFLLDLAYWMTAQRQRRCGCAWCGHSGGAISRPFSPHGQALLLAYWRRALLRSLAELVPPHRPASRTRQPILSLTLEELRTCIGIPIHKHDLDMLLLHSEFSFYQPAGGQAGTASGSEGAVDGVEPSACVTLPKKNASRAQVRSAVAQGLRGSISTTDAASSSAVSPAQEMGETSTGARYIATLVLANALLEDAEERGSKTSRTRLKFEKRWLVREAEGRYAYDTAQFHY